MSKFEDDYLRWYLQQQEMVRQLEFARRAASPTVGFAEAARQMQEHYNQVQRSLLGPTYQLKQLQEAAKALNPQLIGAAPFALEQEQWLRVQRSIAMNNRSGRMRHLADTSPLVWQSSLQTLLEQLRLHYSISRPRGFDASLLSPALDYSRFARSTLQRAARAPVAEASALQASVVLAEVQLTTGTELLKSAMEPRVERAGSAGEIGSSPADDEARETNEEEANQGELSIDTYGDKDSAAGTLFLIQQEELLVAGATEDASYSQLIIASPAAQTVAGARGLTELVVDINQACLLGRKEEIFPPTTAMLRSVSDLLYLSVQNRPTLGMAVDALYMLLYEGSADAKRILTWLPAEACEALWDLKQLRNVWLRHDPEHGSKKEQEKKWAKLAGALARLGASSLPKSASECQSVYDALLSALSNMLMALEAAIVAPP